MFFWILSSSRIFEGKQKPLLKQLWPTRTKIAWLSTNLVLDFLSEYVKVRPYSTTQLTQIPKLA